MGSCVAWYLHSITGGAGLSFSGRFYYGGRSPRGPQSSLGSWKRNVAPSPGSESAQIAAAVLREDALHGGQPDAVALEFVLAVQAFENPEEPVRAWLMWKPTPLSRTK